MIPSRPSPEPIRDWVMSFEETWNERFDAIDEVLGELNDTEERNGGHGK